MTEASRDPAEGTLSLTLTMSCEPALIGAAEALVARMGEQAGCAADDARRLGQAVRRALGGLIGHPGPPPNPGQFEVAFVATSRVARVDLWCACTSADGTATTMHDRLAAGGDDETMRKLVDRVEFGRQGEREYCRLTQQVRPR